MLEVRRLHHPEMQAVREQLR